MTFNTFLSYGYSSTTPRKSPRILIIHLFSRYQMDGKCTEITVSKGTRQYNIGNICNIRNVMGWA